MDERTFWELVAQFLNAQQNPPDGPYAAVGGDPLPVQPGQGPTAWNPMPHMAGPVGAFHPPAPNVPMGDILGRFHNPAGQPTMGHMGPKRQPRPKNDPPVTTPSTDPIPVTPAPSTNIEQLVQKFARVPVGRAGMSRPVPVGPKGTAPKPKPVDQTKPNVKPPPLNPMKFQGIKTPSGLSSFGKKT